MRLRFECADVNVGVVKACLAALVGGQIERRLGHSVIARVNRSQARQMGFSWVENQGKFFTSSTIGGSGTESSSIAPGIAGSAAALTANPNLIFGILSDTDASLIKQYVALMRTEGLSLEFTRDGIEAIADAAVKVNSTVENIGARRLQTIMERLVEELSFDANEKKGETITIDAAYVAQRVGKLGEISGDLGKSRAAFAPPLVHVDRAVEFELDGV